MFDIIRVILNDSLEHKAEAQVHERERREPRGKSVACAYCCDGCIPSQGYAAIEKICQNA